jgi:tRNA (mo5U34)-methyltransferase
MRRLSSNTLRWRWSPLLLAYGDLGWGFTRAQFDEGSEMTQEIQDRIDSINWYHEFSFDNGLIATSKAIDVEHHRKVWSFISSKLDSIEFAAKTVLDIGCWDGYWSFYAEQRGAARVIATDDVEQNWAGDKGLILARELLNSAIEINTNLSVYRLSELQTKFDIILCLGVYYHLIDPFYAFAQIRHCCHDNTIVVFEGDLVSNLPLERGSTIWEIRGNPASSLRLLCYQAY